MKKAFRLEGLCCANCAAKIERKVAGLPGVQDAALNFMTTKLTVDAEDSRAGEIESEVKKIVRRIEPDVVVRKA